MPALWTKLRGLMAHRVARNAFWLYAVQFTGYLLPLLMLPYLSRVLSVEHFGKVAYAQSVMWMFVTLTEYGFNLTATRAVALHRDDPVEISRIFRATMGAKTLLTAIGAAVLSSMVLLVPRYRDLGPLFALSFLSVLGYLLFPAFLFQGLEMMKQVAVRDFLAKLTSLISLFALVRSDADYLWAALAGSLGFFFAGLIGLVSVSYMTPVRWSLPRSGEIREALRTGWPPYVFSATSAFSAGACVMWIEWVGSATEVAYFNSAYRIASAPRMLVSPLSTSIYAYLSSKAGRSEADLRSFVSRNGPLLTLPFLLLSLGMAVASIWLIPVFLGPKYLASRVPMAILSFSPFLLALANLFSTYYMLPLGFDRVWVKRGILSVVLGTTSVLPISYAVSGSIALALSTLLADVLASLLYWDFYRSRARNISAQPQNCSLKSLDRH